MTTTATDPTLIDFDSDEQIDRLVDAVAAPIPTRPPIADRLFGFVDDLAATRLRTFLITSWGCAAIAAIVMCLIQRPVTVGTNVDPANVRCGLDVFLYGYPEHHVASACRHAEAPQLGVFLPVAAVVLAGLFAAVAFAVRRSLRGRPASDQPPMIVRLLRHPVQLALVIAGSVGFVVTLFALRPAPVMITSRNQLLLIRCGAPTFFGHYPDAAVRSACKRAYGGQSHWLEVGLVLTLIGLVALGSLAYSSARWRWQRIRLCAGIGVGLLAAVAVLSLLPVPVKVAVGPPAKIANCGLDAFLVGHPVKSVQSACRSHFASHAAAGIAAAALALLVAGIGAVAVLRSRRLEEVTTV